jgi:hypothetical protein
MHGRSLAQQPKFVYISLLTKFSSMISSYKKQLLLIVEYYTLFLHWVTEEK